MNISKHEEYGLRCVLQLARAGADNLVAVSEISKMEGLSTQYVTKLLSKFLKSGMVNSVRGVTGGYRLAQPADKITLCEVMSSLGESFYSQDLPKLMKEQATPAAYLDVRTVEEYEAGHADGAHNVPVVGCMAGARDPSGQIVMKGWSQEGLPIETGNPSGRAYAPGRSTAGR